jgi:hypothetical protein
VFRIQASGRPGEGFQMGIEAGLFSQFDMRTPANDLITEDYIVAVPISWRRGGTSAKFRVLHRSAHVGDEYLVKSHDERFDLTLDGVSAAVARDFFGSARVYVGWDQVLRNKTTSIRRGIGQAGFDFADLEGGIRLGGVMAQLRGGLDVQAVRDLGWNTLSTAKLGFDLFDARRTPGRRSAGIYLEWLRGPSPAGQFYGYRTSTIGILTIFHL